MLNDDILQHPIFDREFETEEEFNSIEKILAEAGIFMPEKYTWEEPKPVTTIFYDAEMKLFSSSEHELADKDIETLYSQVRATGFEMEFDDSCLQAEGVKKGIFGGIDIKVPGAWRAMFERYDPRPLEFHNYFSFLKGAKYWLENQDDWVAAYAFIENHPMFWSRDCNRIERFPHEWRTDGGHSTLWICVANNTEGPVVMLEGGSSVAPNHDHHYHDYHLDVWGTDFADAYIKFAKNIHKYYSLDGLHREKD